MGARSIRRLEQKLHARSVQAALREASDTLTLPERLVTLAETWRAHATVRDTIARNPSAPPTALALILADSPHAVAKNPVLPLIPLEDPDFLSRPSPLALQRLLLDPQVPLALLEMLQWHSDARIAEAAREHIALAGPLFGVDALEQLSARVAAYPVGDVELLRTLFRHNFLPDRARWSSVLGPLRRPHPLSREARRSLASELLRQAKAQHGTLVQHLAIRSPWNDPLPSLSALTADERLAALLHPRLSRRAIEPRLQDSHRLVRAVAQSCLAKSLPTADTVSAP